MVDLGFVTVQVRPDKIDGPGQSLVRRDPGFPTRQFFGLTAVADQFHHLAPIGTEPLLGADDLFAAW